MFKSVLYVKAIGQVVPILVLVIASDCGGNNPAALSITGSTSRSVTIPAGNEFSVTLQTIGPGAYDSPPTVSSAAVHFLDVAQTSLVVPAGPTQRFRFAARMRGKAIIVFQHSGNNRNVEDTVDVR
jgi:hypothetical protein